MTTTTESPAPVNAHEVALFRDGHVRFRLSLQPWQSAELLLDAADELVQHLQRSLGKHIPSGPDAGGDGHDYPINLILHLDVRADLDREEFALRTTPTSMVIRGRTVSGVQHGVYWFLDRWVGVRWLWPGELGEVVPLRHELTIPLGHWRENPDYGWRSVHTGGAVYQASDIATMLHGVLKLPLAYQREFDRWCLRNRLGGARVLDGHRWSDIAPAETWGRTRPELFAMKDGERDASPHDGKHGNQPCLTNPDVRQLMVEYARAWIDADPALDAVSVALNDSGFPCDCDACRADRQNDVPEDDAGVAGLLTLATDETGDAGRPKRSMSDQLIRHANGVAQDFRAQCPGKKLLTLLYSYFAHPSGNHRLADDVIGQYCVAASLFWHEPTKRAALENLRRIADAVPTLGIYEYYSNGSWPGVHRVFPQLIAESVRAFYDLGARYFATQPSTGFAINGFNLYVLSRCLCDVKTDPAAVLRDYCTSGFGSAADIIEAYLSAWMLRWRETESGTTLDRVPITRTGMPNLTVGLLYTPSFLDARESELQRALELAQDDSIVCERIQWLQKGLIYTRHYADACRLTLSLMRDAELDDNQLPLLPSNPTGAAHIAELASAADEAWQTYWQSARKYLGQYVYDDFWAHYRSGPYGSKCELRKRLSLLAAAARPSDRQSIRNPR